MKNIDTFEFHTIRAVNGDDGHDKWIDVLGYDGGNTAYKPTFSDILVSSTSHADDAEPMVSMLLPAVQSVRKPSVLPSDEASVWDDFLLG